MKAKALTAALIFLAATTTLARAETMNFPLSGSAAGFEAVVEDTTPDAFSFTAKADVEPNTLVQADEILTVTGLGDGVVVPITVSGTGSPGFRINGGSLQDASSHANVSNGDQVELSLMTAADAWETAYAATLTIGTLSGTFNVTTRAAGPLPTATSCYDPAAVGTVGQAGWNGCAGMLIVNDDMIRAAASSAVGGNASYAITGPDNKVYTFEDSAQKIFTGQITTMNMLFVGTSFNGDIGYWDTSNVVETLRMFYFNSAFNQDISAWDMGKVASADQMFYYASAFNQNLSGWCVTKLVGATKPWDFATGSILGSKPAWLPVWGTCPAQ